MHPSLKAMKLSYLWLSKFTDIKKISPKEIGDKLTLHTCELEELIEKKGTLKKIVTGKILDISFHPKTEKLKVAKVDCGPLGKKQILFGSELIVEKNSIVPVALPGAKLSNGMEIAEREIQGMKSEGMICVNSELGLKSDSLSLFPLDTKTGKPIDEIIPEFSDTILDIDNKSLTHRPDLWGHIGFARELSAIFNKKLNIQGGDEKKLKLGDDKKNVLVKIQTPSCRRFCALKISNVKVGRSPLSTQIRLESLAIRAISNIVDVTNLILLELGQPMHAFDAKKIKGSLLIRQAQKGEKLRALDGKEYALTLEDTVVADEEKVLSIAGIMGGEFSGVTDQTTDIILESANWDPAAIRKTSARLGLRSDSSIRYEKALDPENNSKAIFAAAEYILKLSPGAQITSGLVDKYPKKNEEKIIALHPEKVRQISGIPISDKDIVKILESLGFKILSQKYCLEVQVPSYRATKDIAIEEDLIEEVVRLYGFDRIPSLLPILPITPPQQNKLRNREWKIRDFLSARGFLENFNYSFVSEQDKELTGASDSYVKIQNPLSENESLLRITLLSNMIGHIESELRTHRKLDFFEIGKVYFNKKGPLPEECPSLGILCAEMNGKENDLFFRLKTEIEQLFHYLKTDIEIHPAEKMGKYAHPTKRALLSHKGNFFGEMYVVHPSVNPVKNATFVFAEIREDWIQKAEETQEKKYKKISPFPATRRDISIILPQKINAIYVQWEMKKASSFLGNIELFDEFFDNQKFGEKRKNLAFHLEFQSSQKTLSDAEVDTEFKKITDRLNKTYEAVLRAEFDKKN